MPIRQRIKPAIREIVGRLLGAGHETYVVGGAVRDLWLGLEPKDYDIATAAPPEAVRAVFGRRRARIIGRRFRLVHVYAGHECYEISTFRREPTPEERSGRQDDDGVMIWRDNEYGTLEQDAFRRDFTVNALYYDPVGDRGIIDLVGGVADLEARRVRAIGDSAMRLKEDPVRILRALKLVGQFDFTLDAELEPRVHSMAALIQMASRARLFEELLKILAGPYCLGIFRAFDRYALLTHLCPQLGATWHGPDAALLTGLLRERDACVATGNYSTSKSLALATLAFPAAARALGDDDPARLWPNETGTDRLCRDAARRFFEPLPLSRYFAARVRDIIMLVPRLHACRRRERVTRHPEYKYGRALFALLTRVCEWPAEKLAYWPPPDPNAQPQRRRARRGGKRRRRPRRNRHHSP